MTSMGGRLSGPSGATVPSVKALLAFSRRLYEENMKFRPTLVIQSRDGLLWLVGGPSSGPVGATVPSVEAFPFVFLTSRRLEARNASTDGTVAPRGLGRCPVDCWGSFLGPSGRHRTVGGSVSARVFAKPPA